MKLFCFLVISLKLCDTAGKNQSERKTAVFSALRRTCMPPFQSEAAPLERYGHNLTELAKRRTFPPLASDEAMVSRVLQVLQRRRKNSPLLLASDEPRRWAIVAEVIRRMASEDAPGPLLTRQVIGLDYEALFSNLSDDTLTRQERQKQRYAPLQEKLAQAEPDSE